MKRSPWLVGLLAIGAAALAQPAQQGGNAYLCRRGIPVNGTEVIYVTRVLPAPAGAPQEGSWEAAGKAFVRHLADTFPRTPRDREIILSEEFNWGDACFMSGRYGPAGLEQTRERLLQGSAVPIDWSYARP